MRDVTHQGVTDETDGRKRYSTVDVGSDLTSQVDGGESIAKDTGILKAVMVGENSG